MKEAFWIKAHVNAFSYFGGVTRIIQCDNLKTGVIREGKEEIILMVDEKFMAKMMPWTEEYRKNELDTAMADL